MMLAGVLEMSDSHDLRKAPRFRLEGRAKVCFQKEGYLQQVTVRTLDIGMNGAAVASPLALPPSGTPVEFEVQLPGLRAPLRVKSLVRNHRGLRYGIEFLSVTEAQKSEISKYGNGRKPASGVGTEQGRNSAVN